MRISLPGASAKPVEACSAARPVDEKKKRIEINKIEETTREKRIDRTPPRWIWLCENTAALQLCQYNYDHISGIRIDIKIAQPLLRPLRSFPMLRRLERSRVNLELWGQTKEFC